MDANPTKLIEYFSQKRQYLIPLFQRPYIWKKEHWETLWNDILSYYGDDESIADTCPHFMGAIVSIPAKTIPVGVDKYLIIDGQQRLTTLSIILCVLRDLTRGEIMSEEIQDLLVNKYQKNTDDYLKILPTQGDRDVYKKLINMEIESLEEEKEPNQLYQCYKFFKKCINTKTEERDEYNPKKIYDILQSIFQVVMINLTGTDDPYLIFESLNFKGEKLTQTDLIRNLILMKFQHSSHEGGEQERIYNGFWRPLENMLGEQIEDFFFAYLRMKNATQSNMKRIYSDMKMALNSCSTIEDCLNDITKNAKIYSTLLNPQLEKNLEIQRELLFLNRTKSQVIYPFLLKLNSCREHNLSDESYLRCLKILNSFIIRRAICRWQTNVVNSQVINLINAFPSDTSNLEEWLTNELLSRKKASRWPNDDDFRQAIVLKAEASKPIQILFLEGIEKYLSGKEVVTFDKVTLEHIMPQTLSKEWISSLGIEHEAIHNDYLWNLGNLTLTGYNSEYSNYSFSKKKNMENGYSHSGLKMNLEISLNEKWGKEEIVKRAEHLADIAIQLWKYPEPVKNQSFLLSINDQWTSCKIKYLVFDNKKTPVTTWKDAARIILEYIKNDVFHNDPITFHKTVLEKQLPLIDESLQLKQTNYSAESIRHTIKCWLQGLNIQEQLFQFEIEQ